MCELCANELGIDKNDMIVGSTGVIGQKLSIDPVKNNIKTLVDSISEDGSSLACEAIMTTDTRKRS